MATESQSIGVFLLAENRLLRESLARIFSKKSDLRLVGAAAFSSRVVPQLVSASPDVLLLDSAPVVLSGLGMIPEFRRAIPGLKVVMISMDADKETFLRAVCEGAVGYVQKDASAAELIAAVRAVAHGEAVCPPALCLALFEFCAQRSRLPSPDGKRYLGFTRRQQQLVEMIGQGLTNKEIAAQLNLSEQTVKNHVHRMLRKTGAADRLAVVRWPPNTLLPSQL
jgi:DNA-binding NarL/FixJ family response regulator